MGIGNNMKIKIDDIKAQWASTNSINLRFQQIVDELNNKVLYRANPLGEPNAMSNDLDMVEHDILNGGTFNMKELFVDGQPIGATTLWGAIQGDLVDQSDLFATLLILGNRIGDNNEDITDLDSASVSHETRLDDNDEKNTEQDTAISQKMADVRVSTAQNTTQSLTIDRTVPTLPEIVLTPNVGSISPFTLVKTNEQGKIPQDLLSVSGLLMRGVYTTELDADPASNPTVEGIGTPHTNGDIYTLNFPTPQVSGEVLVITDPILGTEAEVVHDPGDVIVYLTLAESGSATGWYRWEKAATGGTATDITYDPLGDNIIQPTSTNVDLAITDLDVGLNTTNGNVTANDGDIATNAADIVAAEGRITQNEQSIIELQSAGAATAAPIGSVFQWATEATPEGFLELNGTTIDATIDPRLQDLVDLLNPGGNTQAVLPDMRGEFARGWDNGKGTDTGRGILSAQDEDVGPHDHPLSISDPTHTHAVTDPTHSHAGVLRPPFDGLQYRGASPELAAHNTNATGNNTAGYASDGASTGVTVGAVSTGISGTVDDSTGVETRPRNIALMYIIKGFDILVQPTAPPDIFDLIYPVGSFYMTTTPANPTALFGGTWAQLGEGEFLMNTVAGAEVAGGSNDAVSIAHGHTATHTLTASQASHGHGQPSGGLNVIHNNAGGDNLLNVGASDAFPFIHEAPAITVAGAVAVVNSGVAGTGLNRPSFKGVAIWERTA